MLSSMLLRRRELVEEFRVLLKTPFPPYLSFGLEVLRSLYQLFVLLLLTARKCSVILSAECSWYFLELPCTSKQWVVFHLNQELA